MLKGKYMRTTIALLAVLSLALASCGDSEECTAENHCILNNGEASCEQGYRWANPESENDFRCEEIPSTPIPILGNGTHSITGAQITVIGTTSDNLNVPRDLEFHPINTNQLWVANRADSSMIVFSNVGLADQSSQKIQSIFDGGLHFLAQPSAISFAANGNFGSIHETDEETQGPLSQGGTPFDFMGPTLWTSDLNIFNAGHSGHLDMMHNSPNGMGIAWEKDNIYWVFDGFHSSITRYDFRLDHGPGGTWHDDGVVSRYVEGQVKRTPDVVSHLEFDKNNNLLYIADTGNQRIATLKTDSGTRGDDMQSEEIYDCFEHPGQEITCADYHHMDNAVLTTFVDGSSFGIAQPSGLALHDSMVYVTDYRTGTIYAFTQEGELLDWLNLERPNSLGGIEFDSTGNLYVVDSKANEVIRISPL